MGKRPAGPKRYPVFAAGSGYAIVRRLAAAEAEMQERLQLLVRAYDPSSGALLGFRVASGLSEGDCDLPSLRTTAGISRREMEMNAMAIFIDGRSRTRGLRELERLERARNGYAPEDEIERVQAKVRVYPLVGAARGDIKRAWPV